MDKLLLIKYAGSHLFRYHKRQLHLLQGYTKPLHYQLRSMQILSSQNKILFLNNGSEYSGNWIQKLDPDKSVNDSIVTVFTLKI